MAAEVRYTPEAEFDISDAYSWYERRSPGLGEEFLRVVDACLSAISSSPGIGRIVHKTYRRAVVRRFPYVIFYEHDQGVVTVYSVFHSSQDPQKWRERLP